MPKHRKARTGRGAIAPGPALVTVLLLSACMGGGEPASMSRLRADQPASVAGEQATSPLISDLLARRSILPPGGAYARVADAVLASDSGADAAELRMARLRAEAQAKNWLPKIGPQVSLSALNGLAAGFLVEQALFDNGRRKAERAYAAADVEVAAVSLSEGINQRVYEGLHHYVSAEMARAQAAVSAKAAARLGEFANLMGQRVEGGLSDRSEEHVLTQRQAEMQATLAADREAEAAAMAELAAMTSTPMNGVSGIDTLPVLASTAEPLSVVKARGEGTRSLAQAQAAKADLLPGISTSTSIEGSGINPGIKLSGGMFGAGTKAQMQALNATQDVVNRRTVEITEAANRRIVTLESQISQLRSRAAQGAEVLSQTSGNLELFAEQYKVGRRTLLELASQYDSYARLERDQASLRYEIALLELEIARDRGVLVDGARM